MGMDQMSERYRVILAGKLQRQTAHEYIDKAADGCVMMLSAPKRTLDQNAAQWPYLDAFSKQLLWPVNGKMVHMTPEEWKDVLTAAYKRESARLAMGLDGGVVMLGMRTSKMDKAAFSDWLEFLMATAAQRNVTVYNEETAHEIEVRK